MVKGGIFLGNRYEVLSKIGAGGMADVYKGRDTMLNRYVAIKVLKKEYREDETFVKKFISEAQAAAGLLNPNIVNVYDVGEDRGLYYMVMELVEGITLKDYIHKKGRLSTREVISITIQMCTGIAAAHSHKIIHRDIKPQNIIISKEGKVKVTDFGIAKAISSNTVTSSAMGSVHYVSPEQARGGYCDEKSDIYSVGITMYEMVTGEVPFDGESTVAIAMKHLQEKITPPSELVPDMSYALEDIILKCTQKSSERRYANIALLIADLKKALTDPDGNFVEFEPAGTDGATVMFTEKDLGKIKKGYKRDYEEDDYDDYDDDEYDDYDDDDYDDQDDYGDYDDHDDYEDYDDYDHEDEEPRSGKSVGKSRNTGVDPRMNKMMKILTIVAAVVIVFVAIFFVGNAIGVFKIGDGGTKQEEMDKDNAKKDIEVPNLLGETEQVAEEMCHKKGLVLEVVEKKNSDQADGTIIEQKIDAGEMVAKNTVIQVVVSSGAEEKVIPDVSGMTEDDAMEELKNNGFTKRSYRSEYNSEYEAGQVIGTEPGVGEKVTVDTEIVIVVSKGAEKKEVPKLEGKTAADAKKALEAAGFKDGGSTEEYSSTVKEGYVISQSVKAGKKVDGGTSISYVVSKGPEPAEKITIPPVSGSTLVEAKQTLKNVGLNNIEVEYVDSPLEAGVVVETEPYVGSKVEVGSVIKLKVSNGSLANIDDGSGNSGNTGE